VAYGRGLFISSFDGKFQQQWSRPPNQKRRWSPRAIALDSTYLYILHRASITIIDNQKNQIVYQWLLTVAQPSQKTSTWRVGVHQDTIYFLYRSHQIFVYTRTGKELRKFGSLEATSKPCEFDTPLDFVFDKKYLYVADSRNNRIQVLHKEKGTLVRQWGEMGLSKGDLLRPFPLPL